MTDGSGNAEVRVRRKNGAKGIISVKWKTIDKSAVNGEDFTGGKGEITFNDGEVREMIIQNMTEF